jgi:hypothetical protein
MLGRWALTIALAAGLAVSSPGVSHSAPKPVTFDVIRTLDVGGTEIIDVTPDGRLLATTNGVSKKSASATSAISTTSSRSAQST